MSSGMPLKYTRGVGHQIKCALQSYQSSACQVN
ncbi:hypothetical protein T03_10283 [Trichinella britovi]|uniref:Uncharacterized protein n=1 Tax=Trichinella britovi TaxID=45882 RepID=A0A0V1AME0_TRIBR|nr:hypothetical protein T03_10283 [Trichinella britovi]